jgi:hypothetical protein
VETIEYSIYATFVTSPVDSCCSDHIPGSDTGHVLLAYTVKPIMAGMLLMQYSLRYRYTLTMAYLRVKSVDEL